MNQRTLWRTSTRSYLILLLSIFCTPAFAFTYYSRANGNWSSPSTWSTDAVNQCLGAAAVGVPGATDDVFICAGFTVTFDVGADLTILNLTVRGTLTNSTNRNLNCNSLALYGLINGAGTKDIRFGNAAFSTLSGTGTMSMSGANISVLNDVSIQAGTYITFNAAGKFDINNKNVTNNGRIDILNPSDMTGTPGNFINNGSGAYLKYTTNSDFPNLLVASSPGNTVEFGQTTGGPYTLGSAAAYHNLIITGAAVKQFTANPTAIGGDLTINNGATLDNHNNDITIAGNWINNLGGFFTEGTRNVTFNGSANNQSILVPAGGETFYSLTINNTFGVGTGTVTPNGTITITTGQALTMTSGVLDMGTNTLGETAAGALYTATGGELRIAKTGTTVPELTGAYTLTGGTTTFNGAGAQTIRGAVAYFNVNVNTSGGSGTKTLGGAVTINGALNISTGTLDVSGSNFAVTANGNWTNTGTFTPRTGTVTVNGSGTQTFTNAAGETFYNLTSNATGPFTLGVNTDVTVTNTLTMTAGDFNLNGRMLTLGNGAIATLSRVAGIMYGGTFRRYVPSGTAISSTVAPLYGLFPMGISGAYRPIAINSTVNATTSGYISATHTDANSKIDLVPTYNDAGTVMTRIHAMQSALTTSGGFAGGTYNIDVSMTALVSAGLLTDVRLLIYTGGTTASAVGTHVATTGSVAAPTGKRTGLTAANLNNIFVMGTRDLVTTPLGPDFFYARATGLWSAPATWSEDATLGCAGAASTIIPRSTDNVIICAGVTVTFDLGATTSIRNLTIQATGVLNMSVNQILNCNSLDLNGTINGAGTKDLTIGNLAGSTLTGTGTFARTNAGGSLKLAGNVTIPNSTDYITFNNNGRLDCSTFTLTNNGRLDILQPSSLMANGTLVNATANSYLKFTTQANLPNGVITATATGNTVEFASAGAGPYALGNLPAFYYNLIFSGTATKQLGTAIQIVLGNLTIANGTTLDTNGNNLTVAGNWINNLGGAFTENSDKVTFNGVSGNQDIFTPAGGENFADLTINNTFAGGIVQANGNITINSGRRLTMTSGIFDMLTNTLGQTGAADFTATGGNLKLAKTNTTLPELTGTYNVTGGTITFNGVGNQTIRSLNAGAISYYNIVLANAGNKTLAGNTLVRGDWTNNSAVLVAGTNTVTFGGTGLQTVTSDSNEPFYNLVVNTTGPLTMQSATDITVSNQLTMTNGLINANGRTLTLGSSGAASILSRTASTTTNWIYGGAYKRFWPAAIAVSSTTGNLYGLFPLGSYFASSYRPLEINTTVNTVGAGSFTAEHIHATNIVTLSPQYNDAGTNIQGISKAQFITSISGVTGGTYNIDVTMTGLQAGTLSDIRLAVFTGGTTASAVGTHAAATGSAPNPTAKRTGITTLTNFNNDFRIATINIGATPLPIELTKFTATLRSGEVAIEWRTETEVDNDLFVVQRSATAEKFTDVAEVNGAGTTSVPTSYIVYDKPAGGNWYYRLKQIDFNGNFTYSKIVAVDVPEANTRVAYPNPSAGDALSINFDQKDLGKSISMLIQDLSGLEVASLPTVKLDSTNLKIVIPQRLLPGIYILSFSVGEQLVRQKIVVR